MQPTVNSGKCRAMNESISCLKHLQVNVSFPALPEEHQQCMPINSVFLSQGQSTKSLAPPIGTVNHSLVCSPVDPSSINVLGTWREGHAEDGRGAANGLPILGGGR